MQKYTCFTKIGTSLCLVCILFLLTGCANGLVQSRQLEEGLSVNTSLPIPGKTTVADMPTDAIVSPITDPFYGVEITFLAAGDNLIHPNIYIDAKSRGNAEKTYDFLPMYEDIAPLVADVDFAFINQETLMAGENYGYSGYPQFNSPRQLGLDLVTMGFDVVSMANNHMLDMGAAGLADSVAFWRSQPVLAIGAKDGSAPAIVEKDGVKIGWLAYTYGTNSYMAPTDASVQVPYIDKEQISADLTELRNAGVHGIIVSVHWGVDNSTTVTDEQKDLAQFLASAGADVILGHHSHCLQPIEWLTQPDGTKTLCIYSLGNLVSGMVSPRNQVGGLLGFTLTSDGNGRIVVTNARFTPTVFYYGPGWYNTHLYLLEDYTDETAKTHGMSMNGYSMTVAQAREIVLETIDAEFLPEYLRSVK